MSEQEIDALLADFRSWLLQAAAAPADSDAAPPAEAEAVDLHTLVSHFVALRHEVNLQTRATRSQQEQNAATLDKLSEAVAAIENSHAGGEQDTGQAHADLVRPFLKTLVDMRDALALAQREAQRVKESVLPALARIVATAASVVSACLPRDESEVFVRFLGAGRAVGHVQPARAAVDPQETTQASQEAERIRGLVTSLIDGYTMSLQRLERTLEQAGLEAIPVIGKRFDPETMEVVEVVHEAGRSETEVLDEVRRGYYWQGRIFRFAQVRVARPAP
jgi:molecular chaperone GrpE